MATLVGNTFTPIDTLRGIHPLSVWSLLVDSRGDTWLGTTEGALGRQGLFRIHGKDTVQVDVGTPFAGSPIFAIAEDGAGNIWLSTYSGYWIGLRDASQNPIAVRYRSGVRPAGGAPSVPKGFDARGRRLRYASRFAPAPFVR